MQARTALSLLVAACRLLARRLSIDLPEQLLPRALGQQQAEGREAEVDALKLAACVDDLDATRVPEWRQHSAGPLPSQTAHDKGDVPCFTC